MRNLDPNYHATAKRLKVVSFCLEKAQRLFPNVKLSFCGFEKNWDDCLQGYRDEATGNIVFLLNFNIGRSTRAVEARLSSRLL